MLHITLNIRIINNANPSVLESISTSISCGLMSSVVLFLNNEIHIILCQHCFVNYLL